MSRARDTANQINRINSSAADATALTVNSSEQLLIGTTDSNVANNSGSGNDGVNIHPDSIRVARTDGDMLLLNRLNSDGDIAKFLKDGTSVGAIGVSGTRLTVGSGGSASGIRFDGAQWIPTISNVESDNGVDIGWSTSRIRNIYTSGGVYLGGTGSANKLDDYEEGTWTPSYSSGYSVSSYTNQNGFYTKIGNVVRASFRLNMSSSSTTAAGVQITGLPFTHTDTLYITGTNYINAASANGDAVKILVNPNSNTINLYYQNTTGITGLVGTNLGTQLDILGQVIYEV